MSVLRRHEKIPSRLPSPLQKGKRRTIASLSAYRATSKLRTSRFAFPSLHRMGDGSREGPDFEVNFSMCL